MSWHKCQRAHGKHDVCSDTLPSNQAFWGSQRALTTQTIKWSTFYYFWEFLGYWSLGTNHKPCPSVYSALSSLQAWGAFIKLFISKWKSVLRLNIWHNEWFGSIKESLSVLKSHTPSVTADSQKYIGIASNLNLSSSSSVFLSWFGLFFSERCFYVSSGENQGLRCLSFMPLGDDTSVTQIT